MSEDPQCRLCGGRGTLVHILAGCQTALRADIAGPQSTSRHLGAGETEEAPTSTETNAIHPIHQGGGEAIILQEDQEEPLEDSTSMGDKGRSGKEITLSPGCPNFPEA